MQAAYVRKLQIPQNVFAKIQLTNLYLFNRTEGNQFLMTTYRSHKDTKSSINCNLMYHM